MPLIAKILTHLEKTNDEKADWNHPEGFLAFAFAVMSQSMMYASMPKAIAKALVPFATEIDQNLTLGKYGNTDSKIEKMQQEIEESIDNLKPDSIEDSKKKMIDAIMRIAKDNGIKVEQSMIDKINNFNSESMQPRRELLIDKLLITLVPMCMKSPSQEDNKTGEILLMLLVARRMNLVDTYLTDVSKHKILYRAHAHDIIGEADKESKSNEKDILNDPNVSEEVKNLLNDAFKKDDNG
jgi:hypothetical protein